MTLCGAGGLFLLAERLHASGEHWPHVFGVVVIASIMTWCGSLLAIREYREEDTKISLDEPKDLRVFLLNLHRRLCAAARVEEDHSGRIRVTIHKVLWSKDHAAPVKYVQLCRYVGGRGGPHRRVTDCRAGIVGRVARTRDAQFVSRDSASSDDDYRSDLVSDWGFTWDEAGQRLANRRSWAAVPILDEHQTRVIGIIYSDSSEAETFAGAANPESVTPVQQVLWEQAQDLAVLVKEKFG